MISEIFELDDFFNSYNPSLGSGKLRDNRLERMKIILSKLGNPEKAYKTIHIAGSKGKGTTAYYLASIIRENGYKCGLYMSPHVYDVRERFSESGFFFSDEDYIRSANELIEALSDIKFPEELGLEKPTTFELYTSYALLLFRNTGCEYAVIETGMGGRLDATNAITPIASVLTAIELEHTNVLGNTIEEIAREKAGIIKRGVPVFIPSYSKEILAVVEAKAAESGSDIYEFSKESTVYSDMKFNEENNSIDTQIKVDGNEYRISTDPVSSIKGYDSLYAFFILSKLGIHKKEYTDVSKVNMPARYEQNFIALNEEKMVRFVFDGAHTPLSAFLTMDTIIRDFAIKQTEDAHEVLRDEAVLIFSLAEGKKTEEICHILLPYFQNIIITGCGSFKKSDPSEIFEIAKKVSPTHNISLALDPVKAVTRAIRRVGNYGTVYTIGSFYLCQEIKNALKELGYES